MSRSYYSEIYLHLVWHTKENLPLLTPKIEALVHQMLRQRVIETPGAYIHAVGGIEDHVHLAVTIPPTLTISEWVGKLKGGVSHDVNHSQGAREALLQWQHGYGVVSFGKGNLRWVKSYIGRQREHHARGRIIDRLERITALEEQYTGLDMKPAFEAIAHNSERLPRKRK